MTVRDLEIGIPGRDGGSSVRALDGVELEVAPGEVVALAGESGAGKSTLGRALLGLFPPRARVRGALEVDGRELVGASERERRTVRGRVVSWIPQTPGTALHPTRPIGGLLDEAVRVAEPRASRREVRSRRRDWLSRVDLEGLDDARAHQLSGGMRQRALVALALATNPRVVVADEPTTALDPERAGAVRDRILGLVEELGVALVWIGHDLGQLRALGGRVQVMLDGRVVEEGPVREVLDDPAHPYTRALIACGRPPPPGEAWARLAPRSDRGSSPTLGCAFWDRCPRRADARCERDRPPLRPLGGDRRAATWCLPEGEDPARDGGS